MTDRKTKMAGKYLITLAIMLAATLIASCGASKTTVEFQEVEMLNNCINSNSLHEQEFIITNQEEYNQIRALAKNGLSECDTTPNIDFNTKTLLGKYAEGSGCTVYFDHKVYLKEQQLVYEIKVQEIGACKMLGSSMNWITVPKLEEYPIVFKVD